MAGGLGSAQPDKTGTAHGIRQTMHLIANALVAESTACCLQEVLAGFASDFHKRLFMLNRPKTTE